MVRDRYRIPAPGLRRLDAPDANVKVDKFCTASQPRKRISDRHSGLLSFVGFLAVVCVGQESSFTFTSHKLRSAPQSASRFLSST
jgi:hypothetical protein